MIFIYHCVQLKHLLLFEITTGMANAKSLQQQLAAGKSIFLVKETDKATLSWVIQVKGANIVTTWGQVSGRLQTTTKLCEGRNLNRSNQTTPSQQAQKEAISLIKKKFDQLYKLRDTILEEDEDELDELDEETQGAGKGVGESSGESAPVPGKKSQLVDFRPMLAQSLDKQKKEIKFEDCLTQVKLDGMRLNAYLENGKVVFKSRNGKDNKNVDYLADSVIELLGGNENLVVDGELYKHQENFNKIISLSKRKGNIKLDYFVYDIYDASNPGASFIDRFVKRFEGITQIGEFVKIVPVSRISSQEDLMNQHQKAVNEKYEGIMVRKKDSKYVQKRSNDLLKVKSFITEEFEIVGFTEGSGRDAKSVVFECELDDGNTFHCRPAWDLQRRQKVYQECIEDFSLYEGKMLTVKFFEFTKDGSLRFPTGVEIRDYE